MIMKDNNILNLSLKALCFGTLLDKALLKEKKKRNHKKTAVKDNFCTIKVSLKHHKKNKNRNKVKN